MRQKSSGRPQRVAELIRQEIGKLLTKGLKDPRIGFVSVMGVRMSPDLRYANVYVSCFGDEKERKSSLIALKNSQGWVRREVSKYLKLRVTPEIRFFEDQSLDEVYNLEGLLKNIKAEQQKIPMLTLTLEELLQEVQQYNSLLLTSHESPDGDAIGSLLGMRQLFLALGKQVCCVMSDPAPHKYCNLLGVDKILACDAEIPAYDVVVILDVAQVDRIGKVAQFVTQDIPLLVIDHHLGDGPSGTRGFIDASYAATGEIVAELFELANVALTTEVAHCLYVAQATDTGGYQYSNTTARSHRIAAKLMEAGIDVAAISHEMFAVLTPPRFELLRRVLDRMVLSADGRLATTWLSASDLGEVNGAKNDIENLVNYARNIEGVDVGVLFNGVDAETTKVSIRATEALNAAEFLGTFGGGGHAAAAGATIKLPLKKVQLELTDALEDVLKGTES